jgi:hypothetical protein
MPKPHSINEFESQALLRVFMHADGGQILASATLERDVKYLIGQVEASLGIRINVQVSRVLDTLALAVERP